MISIRKIVRAINLESKRIEKDYGLSIPQLLTLKFLEEKVEYKSTMKEIKEHLSIFYIKFRVQKLRFLAFSRGSGGFRELREAGRKHFHLSWYLSVPVVTIYDQKP